MKTRIDCALGGTALLLVASLAWSETPETATASTAQPAAARVSEPAKQTSPFGRMRTVSEAALKRIAGREDVSQTVIARNTGTVSNNSIGDNSSTGTIAFDGQAFQGLNGLSVLSANTGNNVSINASLNVNVAIRQ